MCHDKLWQNSFTNIARNALLRFRKQYAKLWIHRQCERNKFCQSYKRNLLQLYLNTSIVYKKTTPPYKSNKNLDRLSDSEIIEYCQIYIWQCHCSLVAIKNFRLWDVYHVRRITTFFYTAAAAISRARKTTPDNVKKGEISKTCIFMEIRE